MDQSHLRTALAHCCLDERLKSIVARFPEPDMGRGGDPFAALCRAIIYQQLSGKAAAAIHERFLALFPHKQPTSLLLLKKQRETLLASGVSNQKVNYLYDLAEKFESGFVTPVAFPGMSDEEIREQLVAIKGVGVWTADMFLLFTLGRMDVLPTLDLGIRKGFQVLFNLRALPDHTKMEKLARAWQPYRSVASWYLWQLADEAKAVKKAPKKKTS